MMTRKIEPLDDVEKAWILDQLTAARQWMEAFAPSDAGQPMTLGALERTLAQWTAAGQRDAGQVAAVLEMVGAVFGQILVENLGLAWVAIIEGQDRELAVHGLPGQGDVLLVPLELVARRWEEGQTDFLLPAYRQIAAHVASLRHG